MKTSPLRAPHIVTKALAATTPVCACRGYLTPGARLGVVWGTCDDQPAWWVACPDCGSALGQAQTGRRLM